MCTFKQICCSHASISVLGVHTVQQLPPRHHDLHISDSNTHSFLTVSIHSLPPTLLQSNCAQYAADRREEEKMCDHLISAAKHRDHVTANQLKQKILNILTNKHGAWGTMSQR